MAFVLLAPDVPQRLWTTRFKNFSMRQFRPPRAHVQHALQSIASTTTNSSEAIPIQEHKISEIMFLPYAIDQILVNDEAVKAEQESDRSRETTKETPTCKRLLKECRRSSRDCCRSWYSRGHTSRCPFWFRMLGKGPPSPSSSSSSTSSGLSNIETSSTSPSPCMHM